MLSVLALFALLVLILASKSFSWIEVKKDKEPKFNYAPTYNPAVSGTEPGNIRPFLPRRLSGRGRRTDDFG